MHRNRWYRAAAAASLVAAAACADRPGALEPEVPRAVPGGIAASTGTACKTSDAVFSRTFRDNVNLDLNDYGRILADSENPSCAEAAAYALYDKVKSTMDAAPNKFKEWLQGANVALIFSAANRLGANGWATKDLDTQLRRVEAGFAAGRDLGCTRESGNQCLDDYSIAASGYAWVAAYKHRRGDSSTSVEGFRAKTRAYIDSTFIAACIHKSEGAPSLCNGTVAELSAGTAKTLSLNHGQQMPSYGFGLMTSIATAVLGLEASGTSYAFGTTNRTIARGLFEEAQRAVDASVWPYQFRSNCVNPFRDAYGNWWLGPATYFCGGPDNYQPQMYRLDEFYRQYLGGIPGPVGAYRSDWINDAHFQLGPNDNTFFGVGRHQTYGNLGYSWVASRREYLPFDAHNPIGYLDGVSATGVASGWTCDKDAPTKAARVDFYANGTYVMSARANGGSEQAVNDLCGGGTAHRYAVQLPAWTKGYDITAYGLDYTWFGFTQLACLQSPRCSW